MSAYKNIVFDFGNVLASFDEHALFVPYCQKDDMEIFSHAIFYNWQALDEGAITYDEYCEHSLSLLPPRLHEDARRLFENWYKHMEPIPAVWDMVHTLKALGYRLYILSNAPTYFAEHADYFEIVKEFDGIVFSAPIRMYKPKRDIYEYLFRTYELDPAECFFIDDKEENISGARAAGMDGIVFTGDTDAVKRAIGI